MELSPRSNTSLDSPRLNQISPPNRTRSGALKHHVNDKITSPIGKILTSPTKAYSSNFFSPTIAIRSPPTKLLSPRLKTHSPTRTRPTSPKNICVSPTSSPKSYNPTKKAFLSPTNKVLSPPTKILSPATKNRPSPPRNRTSPKTPTKARFSLSKTQCIDSNSSELISSPVLSPTMRRASPRSTSQRIHLPSAAGGSPLKMNAVRFKATSTFFEIDDPDSAFSLRSNQRPLPPPLPPLPPPQTKENRSEIAGQLSRAASLPNTSVSPPVPRARILASAEGVSASAIVPPPLPPLPPAPPKPQKLNLLSMLCSPSDPAISVSGSQHESPFNSQFESISMSSEDVNMTATLSLTMSDTDFILFRQEAFIMSQLGYHPVGTSFCSKNYTHKNYTHKNYTHKNYTHKNYTHKNYTHKNYTHTHKKIHTHKIKIIKTNIIF
jgi:hypothetical protein